MNAEQAMHLVTTAGIDALEANVDILAGDRKTPPVTHLDYRAAERAARYVHDLARQTARRHGDVPPAWSSLPPMYIDAEFLSAPAAAAARLAP